MVNEAYLNRLNTALMRCCPAARDQNTTSLAAIGVRNGGSERSEAIRRSDSRSVRDEACEIDCLHPIGLGIDHQSADCERDAVGDSALLGVQPREPLLPSQLVGQWPLADLQQQKRQGSAKQRGVEQVV